MKNDFSKGAVWKHILSLAIPMTIAQVVQLLYNIVDRLYIGRLPGASSYALTGLGLTFPVITIVTAFSNLFGMGGTPLCSIARGMKDTDRAEKIMGNTFTLLAVSCVAIIISCYSCMKPMLYLFGASENTYSYAAEYLKIYLIGTPFVMLGSGMNGFINAQGFGKTGMITIIIGAVINIILDPIFIFGFSMGISGAAAATVISQFVSALWVLGFLFGKKTLLKMRRKNFIVDKKIALNIVSLGICGFVMSATNGLVQATCNSTLRNYNGDLYIGIMTVITSIRDICTLPVHGLTSGAQPVIGFNYGAKEYGRVKSGITFMSIVCVSYTFLAWIIVSLFPKQLLGIFTPDAKIIEHGVNALHLYFFGFFMMALQFSGQSAFLALGQSKHAVFFSLMRKAFIVVPLTILLPKIPFLGVNGVFIAEAASNFIGGTACFVTMLFVVRKIITTDINVEKDIE